jgi:hypothetical protein
MSDICLNANAPSFIEDAPEIQEIQEVECQGNGQNPCSVCILRSGPHDDSVKNSVAGTIRCIEHQGICGFCSDEGCKSSSLFCKSCWKHNKLLTVVKIQKEILASENRLCRYTSNDLTTSLRWECGCASCINDAASYFKNQYAFSLAIWA